MNTLAGRFLTRSIPVLGAVLWFLWCLAAAPAHGVTLGVFENAAGASDERPIDVNRGKQLMRKFQAGERLTPEEQTYLERVKQEIRNRAAGKRPGPATDARTEPLVVNTSDWSALVPITDMTSPYKGQDGGLYGGGRNEPPQAHGEAYLRESKKIRPLDENGQASDTGKIGLISIGFSNTSIEWEDFRRTADADPQKSSRVVIVNGAIGGRSAVMWAWDNSEVLPKTEQDRLDKEMDVVRMPKTGRRSDSGLDKDTWPTLAKRIEAVGLSPKQVQVCWLKHVEANPKPLGEFPAHARALQADITAILNIARDHYPNLRIAYLSSRTFGGWSGRDSGSPEPYAYESGFGTRWVVQSQIRGDASLNYDPARGRVKAPLVLWGPYLWACGDSPRKLDGLTWTQNDVRSDRLHPNESGCKKTTTLLLNFFKTDPGASRWFLKPGETGRADDALTQGTPVPAGRTQRPNILWIMADQLRYDCVGANGNRIIKTPHLDRLAEQSANFSNAFVQAPVCVPSRASFFTGRYPHSHRNRVNYTPLAASEVLLPARLKAAGYRTAIVGKSHLYYHYPPTAEEARLTGFELVDLHDGVPFTDPWSAYAQWRQVNDPLRNIPYRRLARTVPQLRAGLPAGANPWRAAIDECFTDTSWTGLRTRERLKELAADGQPFFLFCSFWKPHSPYEVSVPFDSMYSDVEIPLPESETLETIGKLPPPLQKLILRGKKPEYDMDRAQLQWLYRSYYGTVSHLDREVGLILDALKEAGIDDNTLVVFTSDHGDQLLEHGLTGKNVFFEASIHVPLMICWANRVRPGRYDALVESVDVLPTLLELAGLPEPENCQGRSLLPICSDSRRAAETRDAVFSENVIPEVITSGNLDFSFAKGAGVKGVRHPDAKMVRTRRWKYIYYPDGYEELYDMQNDPHERQNLAADPARKLIVDDLRQRLLNWLITADEVDQIAPKWVIPE